jgi:hypothetical protein
VSRTEERTRDAPTPGTSPLRWDRRDAIALAFLGLVVALPLVGLLRYQGPPMEEGFMLAFPEQILDGRFPHRDFLHLYGPGSLYVLAVVYAVFGADLTVERMVGLVQLLAFTGGLYALLRPWGRRLAAPAAAIGFVILLMPLGLAALAWNGALALGICAVASGAAAVRHPVERSGRRLAAVAGVLGGAALLYRPDMVLAVGLGLGVVWWELDRRRRTPLLVAAGATVALYVPHLLVSGPADSFRGMFLEPVVELRDGRALPVPPSWDRIDGFLQRAGALRTTGWPLPMPELSHQIHLWFWLVPLSIVLTVAVAWVLGRREPGSARATSFWPASLFGAALISQALQRPDTTHLAWVTCVTFPLAVVATSWLLERWRPAWPLPARTALAVGAVLAVLVVVIPFYPLRTYADLVGQSFGRNRFGFEIRNGDRWFYYGDEATAADAQRVVDELAERSRPGQRLVVGPQDLSRTNYSDSFFYHLFPELVPGTRYIEMDPGIADTDESGLAVELEHNDWLIRSVVADGWEEPNTSAESRSPAANRVVEREYCEVLSTPSFVLSERCRER